MITNFILHPILRYIFIIFMLFLLLIYLILASIKLMKKNKSIYSMGILTSCLILLTIVFLIFELIIFIIPSLDLQILAILSPFCHASVMVILITYLIYQIIYQNNIIDKENKINIINRLAFIFSIVFIILLMTNNKLVASLYLIKMFNIEFSAFLVKFIFVLSVLFNIASITLYLISLFKKQKHEQELTNDVIGGEENE